MLLTATSLTAHHAINCSSQEVDWHAEYIMLENRHAKEVQGYTLEIARLQHELNKALADAKFYKELVS